MAKERTIEQGRPDDAAALSDQAREWCVQARSIHRARMSTMAALRRRFGISPPPAER